MAILRFNDRLKKSFTKNSCIKFNFDLFPKKWLESNKNIYPFAKDDVFVYLGRIIEAPSKCIITRVKDGKVFVGYEIADFIKAHEKDIKNIFPEKDVGKTRGY